MRHARCIPDTHHHGSGDMTARIRHLYSIGLTAMALLILATARLPDTPAASIPALRTSPESTAPSPAAAGWAIRLGLATLLIAGLAFRLREEN
jgi:hypothetical protein